MIIYHGSKMVVEKPIAKGSNPFNDYGPAFYLTLNLDAAKAWACKNDSIGVVNKYRVENREFASLKVLDLTDKDRYGVLNWVAILMHFRSLDTGFVRKNALVLDYLASYYIDVEKYDVIIGYRADDSYFRFPIRFISNDLAFDDLEDVYLSGDLGKQYAFLSEKAIDLLKFDSFIECETSFLGKYYSLVSSATKKFDALLNLPRDPRKTYVLDLMRKENEENG